MSGTTAAAGLALLTAFLYALSKVLQMLEAEQVPDEYSMRPGLLVRLVRRPRWLAGVGADAAGYVTHAAALGLAAVVFVEPIIASGILMALFVGSAFTHTPVRRTDWIAAAVLAGGIAVFVLEVSPSGGDAVAPGARWLVAGPLVAIGIGVCLVCGRRAAGAARAALLGGAAGLCFGAFALLTKASVHYLGDGLFAWVPHWEPYVLAVVAIGAVVVAQSALQTGALGAAVGAIEATGTLSATVLGLALLGEHVHATGPAQVAVIVAALVAIAGGIATLARAEERLMAKT